MRRIGRVKNMPMDINVFEKEKEFEWEISNFSSLRRDDVYSFKSPLFCFAGESWYLKAELLGLQDRSIDGVIGLYLRRKSPGSPVNMEYTLGLKTCNGKLDCEHHRQHIFKEVDEGFGTCACIMISELYERKKDLMPNNNLTVFCNMKYPPGFNETARPTESLANSAVYNEEDDVDSEVEADDDSEEEEEDDDDEWEDYDDDDDDDEGEEHLNFIDEDDANSEDNDADKVECPHCKELFSADSISSHQRNCIRRTVKCPDCLEVISLLTWLHNHECKNKIAEGEGSLSYDFKNILLDGLNHDVVLKVSDGEFQAHRDILRARSQVFNSMLTHDMIEKNSGTISILDCDSKVMKQFLSYIYSGKIEALDISTVHGLFYVADKYNVKGLKTECCNYMKVNLSPTNVGEAVQIATDHSESSLLEFISEYMMSNMKDIVCTTEWQSFFKDNTAVADKLIRKCLTHNNFCEVFQFAVQHNHTNLLQHTVEYFKEKKFMILTTAAFDSLVTENGTIVYKHLFGDNSPADEVKTED